MRIDHYFIIYNRNLYVYFLKFEVAAFSIFMLNF